MTQGRFHAFDLSLARARHRGVATLAAAALALVAAGCGGGGGDSSGGDGGGTLSKSEYEQRIKNDGREVQQAFQRLSSRPGSLAQLSNDIKRGQDELRKVADDLDGATPPDEIAEDNDKLAAGLRKVADLLEPLRKGAEEKNPQKVQKAVQDLQNSTALKDAQAATKDMKEKGYEIGTFGG